MTIDSLYKILIIDDNPEFASSLKNLLIDIAESYIEEIQIAYNGFDGLELLRDNEYHFVFMDINMPSINGIEATRFAKFEYKNTKARIIGISFHKELSYINQMMKAGASAYLSKDEIDADKLAEILGINVNSTSNK